MNTSALKTLSKLRENGSKGVTWDDFPRGYAIRSRISELRENHEINTVMESLDGSTKRARYFLIGKKKQVA